MCVCVCVCACVCVCVCVCVCACKHACIYAHTMNIHAYRCACLHDTQQQQKRHCSHLIRALSYEMAYPISTATRLPNSGMSLWTPVATLIITPIPHRATRPAETRVIWCVHDLVMEAWYVYAMYVYMCVCVCVCASVLHEHACMCSCA